MRAARISLLSSFAIFLIVTVGGCRFIGDNDTANSSGSGSSGSTASGVVAFAYVGSATSTSDERIFGFAIKNDGSISALPNSPYSGAANSLISNSPSLFALGNSTGNALVSYARAGNGSLKESSSAPVSAHTGPGGPSSGGVSLSLDRAGQSLYVGVINAAGAENNQYAVYNVSSGKPQFVANTQSNVNIGGALLFSSNNRFAYTDGCHFADWDVVGLARGGDGTLTFFNPNGAMPVTATKGSCPGRYAISAKNYFAVVGHDGQTGEWVIATYTINSDGTLGLAKKLTLTGTNGVTALKFDPGTGAFLASADDRGIVMYTLANDGTLTQVGSIVSGAFRDVHWDSAGHVYAIDAGAFYAFNNNNGVLSPLGSPQSVPSVVSLSVL
jgi:6-phosphogluconolactonase (cycloisomerase 2 family)